MENITGLLTLIAVCFSAGYGWGQWSAERAIRRDKNASEAGRLVISMPMKADDAAATLGLLRDLVEEVENGRAGQ